MVWKIIERRIVFFVFIFSSLFKTIHLLSISLPIQADIGQEAGYTPQIYCKANTKTHSHINSHVQFSQKCEHTRVKFGN